MPPRNATPGTRVYRLLVRVGSLVGTGGGWRAGSSEAARAVVIRDPRAFLRLRAMLLAIPDHATTQIPAALLCRYRHGAYRDKESNGGLLFRFFQRHKHFSTT